jgi:hypothetical protein
MTERVIKQVNDIWDYIKNLGADKYGSGIDVRKKDIQESVFDIDGELRISGEEANNFSSFFVNYYDFPRRASAMIEYLNTSGWSVDWYSPGYIVASRKRGK